MEKLNKNPFAKEKEALMAGNKFSTDFFSRYEGKGMVLAKNDSLHNDEDPSLLFSNSTMFRYKNVIRAKELPASGIAAQQLCLRTPDLTSYDKEGFVLGYPSLFNMVGLILPKDFTDTIFQDTYDWLISVGVSPERIHIKTKEDDFLANLSIQSKMPRVLYDTEDPAFYEWNYGVEGLQGEGLTFSILQKDGSVQDVGNIIAFKDADRNLLGWETAFGIETLTARRDNMPLYGKHLMFQIFGEITKEQQKPLLDALGSVAELIAQGFNPGPKKQDYVVRRYLNIIERLSKRLSVDIGPLLLEYCTLREQDGPHILSEITSHIRMIEEKRVSNIKNLSRYLTKHPELSMEEKTILAKSSFSLESEDIQHLL